MQRCGTALLAPYRAVGQICSSISPVYIYTPQLKTDGYISCVIENIILNYSITPFRLHSATNPLSDEIQCIANSGKHFFAAIGNCVVVIQAKNLQVSFYFLFLHNFVGFI